MVVHWREEKVVKGSFGKDEGGEWKMDCRCGLECEVRVGDVKDVEVCVALDGDVTLNQKVEMVVKMRKRGRCFEGLLEEIPEQMSEGEEVEECCCCSECGGGGGGDEVVDYGGDVVEAEVEGVRWAVDVGIWVMCLGVGVGYLVSKLHQRVLGKEDYSSLEFGIISEIQFLCIYMHLANLQHTL
ncbi:hypothetical protein CTI12_AA061340 [Artemisia annua]|uniref:Uncharacterized protein n=1 Tax=Artemisia annua TaxID=35608 RepID=A0A2U1Q8F0_ARTAN|nr:hypothetical protein CTI12_AA061340 [Artemisia annua]